MTAEEKKRRSALRTIKLLYTLAVITALAAILAFLYPSVSDGWNRYVANQMITRYEQVITEKAEVQNEQIDRAREYNAQLFEKGSNHVSEYTLRQRREEWDEEYEEQLSSTNMMAYVSIPKIHVEIPIKHYTIDDVLKDSVGHVYGTSLPVGGPSSHSVISGHNALLTARLFTDLEKLEMGDTFSIHVAGKKLNYEVGKITTVLPNELEELTIEEGKDYMTLLTCTPYGVNTHRILFRGERIADEIEHETHLNPIEVIVKAPVFMFVLVAVLVILAIFLIIYIWKKEAWAKKRELKKKQKEEQIKG